MRRFKRQFVRRFFVLIIAVVFLSTVGSTHLQAAIIFESGTLGPTGVTWQQAIVGEVPGKNVDPGAFTGVRFQVTQPVMTTQVGGHFVGPPNIDTTFFAAIIELDDENDFPDSNDLSFPDVLGTALLTFPEPSNEVFENLALTLDPGWYAIMFGGGFFGANGNGINLAVSP